MATSSITSTTDSGALQKDTFIPHHLTCSICMDMLDEPVTSICGHTFCKKCLSHHLENTRACPLCKHSLLENPAINVIFKSILQEYRQIHGLGSKVQAPDEITCDMCPNNGRCKATKSCLICLMSYCDYHLKGHQTKLRLQGHKLVAPVKDLDQRACLVHGRPLELYCIQNDKCICSLCVKEGTEVTSVENESVSRKKILASVIKNMEQRMQHHQEKVKEFQHSTEKCLALIKREKEEIKEIFEAVRKVVGEAEQEALGPLEEKACHVERELKDLSEELQREITEFKKIIYKLQTSTEEEDHIFFLQNYLQTVPASESGKDWTNVTMDTHLTFGTMRNLVKIMKTDTETELNKLSSIEIERIKKYSVDVTLDPNTSNAQLLVSDDMREVQDTGERRTVPDSSDRFDVFASILGLNQLPRDKSFWVVDVSDKQGWDIGVAKEKANRKGNLSLKPSQGYWVIVHYNGDQYAALEDSPIPLLLQDKPQKVGVFVDQQMELVSFYDIGAKAHIYSFTGCVFEDEILPYFSPHLKQGETNSSPLVICPVNLGD
ncbi:E3 ubiquitin-protein ligase TRIM21-like isoform X1 [Electrophorus electricus]|uniref:E3 ubiquitin-protein ligase TRIM21-like isoform X1 n=2 Tax=Electrophorus electricus TaxID=8005 RepID=UPI000F09F0C4|nr:E3 ubiquitin-protein ligase TRIM21-like isoform X1 [Electrophorus electricus]XP_035385511.1 E3 ubiquitin-protein ligase TRIM21-like isoform X1 [Electrophorus electricus]XP_035385514.1 E3 ubiquitin-protein ligase TRIM21-like isoform X1 [Electrophorus electricus]